MSEIKDINLELAGFLCLEETRSLKPQIEEDFYHKNKVEDSE